MSSADEAGLAETLNRHGRAYGALSFVVAFTVGLTGDDAKTSKRWQSHPHQLANAEHGAAILVGRGLSRNPVVALRASNLIGVDIDGDAGRLLCRKLVPDGLPPTVSAQTGRPDGGLHLYYRPPPGGSYDAKIEFGEALKMSSDGYLVLPPATHGDTGRRYAFLEGHAPWARPIAVLPKAILETLAGHKERGDEAARADEASPIAEGGRHRHLLRIGCAMRRAGAREESIRSALLVENEIRCSPPKDKHIVHALALDIATRYPPGARP